MNWMFRRLTIFVIALTIAFLIPKTPAPEAVGTSFTVLTIDTGGVPYISAIELAERFHIVLSYDPLALTLILRLGENTLTVSHRSSIARLNDDMVNMVYPARLVQGALFVPASTFIPVFDRMVAASITWNDKTRKVDVGGVKNTIQSIRFEEREGGTLITFALTSPMTVKDHLENRWLTLAFSGGAYDPGTVFANLPADAEGIIREVRHLQEDGEAQFHFEVTDNMESYNITRRSNPDELMVALRYRRQQQAPITDKETMATPVTPSAAPPAPIEPKVDRDLWIVDTVVIDAGHGGREPGAVGPGGTKEKDITLSVARELKRIIDERGGVKAVMTRSDDRAVGLNERAKIANNARGKLFVSIHANASTSRAAKGMEIYFLSDAKTESARLVAERENSVIEFEEDKEAYGTKGGVLDRIRQDMASNVFLKESQDMCALLLDRCVTVTGLENRGVKQAGFYVMLGTQASMPSVLFEIGFISNPDEEKVLRRISYQKRLAEAMYESIMAFKQRAERDILTNGR